MIQFGYKQEDFIPLMKNHYTFMNVLIGKTNKSVFQDTDITIIAPGRTMPKLIITNMMFPPDSTNSRDNNYRIQRDAEHPCLGKNKFRKYIVELL